MRLPWSKKQPEPELKPQICQCTHIRSVHEQGKSRCHAGYPVDDEWPHGAHCACQIFIPYKDPGDDEPPKPVDPSLDEIEKIYKL
jgi:hypothetical protein